MKHLIISLTMAVAVVVPNTSIFGQKDVKDDIIEANERFVSLFTAGDAAAFVEGMYTDDAVVYPPNSPMVKGQESLIGFWGGMIEAGIIPKVITNTAVAYGKTAIEDGIVEIYAGEDKVDEVKYILIWKKEGKTWKIQKDIWNSNMPAN